MSNTVITKEDDLKSSKTLETLRTGISVYKSTEIVLSVTV